MKVSKLYWPGKLKGWGRPIGCKNCHTSWENCDRKKCCSRCKHWQEEPPGSHLGYVKRPKGM